MSTEPIPHYTVTLSPVDRNVIFVALTRLRQKTEADLRGAIRKAEISPSPYRQETVERCRRQLVEIGQTILKLRGAPPQNPTEIGA